MYIPNGETLEEKNRIHQEEIAELKANIERIKKDIRIKIELSGALSCVSLLVIGGSFFIKGISESNPEKTTIGTISLILWGILLPKFIQNQQQYSKIQGFLRKELKKLQERKEILDEVNLKQ